MNQNKLTPQERFKDILKDSLNPIMKKYGFRKKGTKYICIGDKLTYLISINKSRYNSKESLYFQMRWEIEINEDQKKQGITCKGSPLHGELEDLTKDSNLIWLQLKDTDLDPYLKDAEIKTEISKVLESIVIPFLFSFKSIKDIIRTLEDLARKEKKWPPTTKEGITYYDLASLYYYIGKPQKSLKILDTAIKECKIESFKRLLEGLKQQIIEGINH
ncbi:MAG: DUF4304 domain-containing protein [Nitrososphaerales archaeon]